VVTSKHIKAGIAKEEIDILRITARN